MPDDVAPERLALALRAVGRAIRSSHTAAGLEPLPPTELDVVRVVAARPGLSVGEVADALGLRTNNASAAVRSLVARGLIARRPDATDGRVVRLHATSLAIAHRGQIEAAWADDLVAALDRLPPADQAVLLAAGGPLQRLAHALQHPADRADSEPTG